MSTTELQTTGPDLATIVGMAVNGLDSPHSRRVYGRALEDFMAWQMANGQRPLSRALVHEYRAQLKDAGMGPASMNLRLTAIKRLAHEAAANGFIGDDTARSIKDIRGIQQRGVRAGDWLTKAQAEALLDAPDKDTLRGKRDRALLAVLIGCGLRRDEASHLAVEHVQQREGRWVLVDIVGKRNKVRSVPMPAWCKALIDAWAQAAGITAGLLFHEVTQTGKMDTGNKRGSAGLSSQSIMRTVRRYGAAIGKPNLAPHDLRRTFAKLANKGGAPLEQISINLGHESLMTTQKYLGVGIDYQRAPADYLGLDVSVK